MLYHRLARESQVWDVRRFYKHFYKHFY